MLEAIIIILIAALAVLGFFAVRWREERVRSVSKLAEKDRWIASLEERADDKARLVTTLEEKLLERDRTIANLNAQMQLRSEEADAALGQLDGRDTRISDLEAEIGAQADTISYQKAVMLTLANASYDALIVVDRDCKILAINNTAEALFGVTNPAGSLLANITGAPELTMMVDDALTNEEESFETQLIINMSNYKVASKVVKRDGHYFIALALQDITQLVRLNRARRDMVANISHELRTPIAKIRSIIDSLFHDQDKPKRKDSIHSLREIARETDNLLWLVQEMMDLSMIESGQAIVRMIDNQLSMVVQESFERLTERAAEKDINLVRHVPEKLHVLCDRDLVQRVLVNLIHNAIKWSPEGEPITVNASNGGDEVTIYVLDNGPGVPSDSVDRIFERFFQVDSSRSTGDGTGLGLAICRHIVEAHGGRIWAEANTDGSGGRFAFTLLSAGEHEPEPDVDLGLIPPVDVEAEAVSGGDVDDGEGDD